VIDSIRAYDSDNLIIAGTPNWSQNVDEAANNPIADTNIAYALHFYASTHKQWLRDRASNALKKNAALVIAEWGTCESSGNGAIDEVSVSQWMNFCRVNRISHLNWALNDKSETASLLKSGVSVTGGWTQEDLTASGIIVREIMDYWPEEPPSSTGLTAVIDQADFALTMNKGEMTILHKPDLVLYRIYIYDVAGKLLYNRQSNPLQGNSFTVPSFPTDRFLIIRAVTNEGVISRVAIQ
jgi:hypothetical protein